MTTSFFCSDLSDETAFKKGLCSFLDACPTSFHTAATAVEHFISRGFTQLSEGESWAGPLAPGGYITRRGGAFIAWYMPQDPQSIRMIGTHTDSPAFKVKPSVTSDASHGYQHIDVEPYGGMLMNSWLNRELGLAGLLIDKNGKEHLASTHSPVMIIPQLAIHLDRSQNDKLTLQRQNHLHPLAGNGTDFDLLAILADSAEITKDDIVGFEVYSYDTHQATLLGDTMVAASRQDNLLSVYSAISALSALVTNQDLEPNWTGSTQHGSTNEYQPPRDAIVMIIGFDHEEIGSHTRYGAAGSFLEDVLTRLSCALQNSEDDYRAMLNASSCLSVDVVHGFNPNYPDKHDPSTQPILGAGPTIKYNANQRYPTDAFGQRLWNTAAQKAGVATQSFVSHNDVTCGSTIGPMIATRLGVVTVDAGVPIWSMHSAREVSDIQDSLKMTQLMRSYLRG